MINEGYCGSRCTSSNLDEWRARLVHTVSAEVRSFVHAVVILEFIRLWLIINTISPNLGEYL